MGNLNKVFLIGRFTKDMEIRTIPSGMNVLNNSIATSEKYKDKSGQMQEKTEFHNVVFWGRQAEIINQYCRKGSQIYIEGSLGTEEWQDKDGNKRYTTKVTCRNLQLLDSKGQSQAAESGQSQTPMHNEPPQGGFIPDDIPF